MSTDLEARDSNGKAKAVERLSSIISAGAEQQNAIIQRVLNVTITDKLVDPRMASVEEQEDGSLALRYKSKDVSETVTAISDHALGQMCGVAKVPKIYVNALLAECVGMSNSLRKHLICYLFNTHFHNGVFLDKKRERTKFLHRTVGNTLLGFLSRNYNRKLGTKDMLRPFLEENATHGAKSTEAFASPLRVVLKCVQPIIYEPIPGEFVALGCTYANSDFGSGSLLVTGVVLRISSGTSAVLTAQLRKIHLGAVISDEEIELSEETLRKESETHASAVRDMVRNVYSKESIEECLSRIKYSIEHRLAWSTLATQMRDVLNVNELTSMEEMLKSTKSGIIDLPPITSDSAGDPEANAWWAAAALGVIAGRVEDAERKASIQELAGKLIGPRSNK